MSGGDGYRPPAKPSDGDFFSSSPPLSSSEKTSDGDLKMKALYLGTEGVEMKEIVKMHAAVGSLSLSSA